MRILVVGSGGREHALAWKLAQEADVICAPGNPGIAEDVECVPILASDFEQIGRFCKDTEIDLVVVGPEDPLVAGLADELRRIGVLVYGPGKDGAQLEGSKAFSKETMLKAGVPTAEHGAFVGEPAAKEFARQLFAAGKQVVVKASGNALGKGVVVCGSLREAEDAIDMMMVDREFGEAGSTVVVEERLSGPEFSLLTLCSDHGFWSLPVSQDFKRALDGDRGPNTGGMGSYSPVPWISDELVREAEATMVAPILAQLRSDGISYRGTLYSGVMVHGGKPYCLEYNVRFGDPETQSVMRRLGSGFAEALRSCAAGEEITPVEVLDNAVVSVVVASGGYPGSYPKGLPIEIAPVLPPGVKLFHAGTASKDGSLVTNGGRVLAVSAQAGTVESARDLAYQGADCVIFEGKQLRTDIASTRERGLEPSLRRSLETQSGDI